MAENNIKTTLYTRNVFSPEEADLYELTQLSGITIDSHVFKIITDLLKMNTQPAAIVKVSVGWMILIYMWQLNNVFPISLPKPG